jgi:hypothetical protein
MSNLKMSALASLLFLIVIGNANAVPLVVPSTAVRTLDVTDICSTKTSTIRDVSLAVKKKVYAKAGVAYGDRKWCSKGYEVDHRVSLENGGSNDISNLQLQAYCTLAELTKGKDGKPIYQGLYDAHKKDGDENKGHTTICKGLAKPAEVQQSLYYWKN